MGKALNGKELGKGITQRKDKLYQARYINRFGKRVTLYGKTLSEITKKLREAQYNDEQQSNLINTGMTLDEWYERWITTCKQHCRNTTLRSYAICYNRLRAELGWRKLSSLNLIVLQEAFNHLKTDASRSDSKAVLVDMLNRAVESDLLVKNVAYGIKTVLLDENSEEKRILSDSEIEILLKEKKGCSLQNFLILGLETGMRMGDDDDKIRLNQRKPSKYKGLSRFGPEKNLQRINKFMKERPIFYKNLIQMKENFRFYLRCFYCITKVVILQFNSENRTELARNG